MKDENLVLTEEQKEKISKRNQAYQAKLEQARKKEALQKELDETNVKIADAKNHARALQKQIDDLGPPIEIPSLEEVKEG